MSEPLSAEEITIVQRLVAAAEEARDELRRLSPPTLKIEPYLFTDEEWAQLERELEGIEPPVETSEHAEARREVFRLAIRPEAIARRVDTALAALPAVLRKETT